MKPERKLVVLIIVGHYRPGYKAGGILRSVENLVLHLHGDFEFRIITGDRDLGDDRPYPGLRPQAWHQVGEAQVYYLSPSEQSLWALRLLVNETPHDVLFINSYFEPLGIKLLAARWCHLLRRRPILLAPRGEFAWASLGQKYPKKWCFMRGTRAFRLHRGVVWMASSAFELEEIRAALAIPPGEVHIAPDLPGMDPSGDRMPVVPPRNGTEELRVIFLSRISPEKNLDFALRVLARVRCAVTFDIFGPLEHSGYWAECEKLLPALPSHVKATVRGSIPPAEVMETLRGYDLLFLPSGGENYGHVIAEALSVGTAALISRNTPWRDLASLGLGWDLPLEDPDAFVRVLEEQGRTEARVRRERRAGIRAGLRKLITNSGVVEVNRALLQHAIDRRPAATVARGECPRPVSPT